MRFVYAYRRTRADIEAVLEDCFATGDILESENPRIVILRGAHGQVTGYGLEIDG